MVSQAIDEGLLARIRNYVATDINSRIVMSGDDKKFEVKPEEVFITSFSRVLNNWQATATAQDDLAGLYVLTHNGELDMTIAKIYTIHATNPAIL